MLIYISLSIYIFIYIYIGGLDPFAKQTFSKVKSKVYCKTQTIT